MALSSPRTIYGIHNVTFFSRSTRLPFGIMKCIGSLSFDFSGEMTDLYGGSQKYPWDSETGVLNSAISLSVKEFPDFGYQYLLGATVSENEAEASGNCGTLTNQYGTSVVSATTGVATATAKTGESAELKDALIIVKAVSATTVDCYAVSDVDFATGTDKTFVNDDCKITESPLTIATDTAVEVPEYGIELTGGTGTIAMTEDDTAYVWTRKINDGSSLITLGKSTAEFSSFGLHVASQKKGSGDVSELVAWNCKGIGMPHAFTEQEWMNAEINIRALYDSDEDAVAYLRHIKAA